MRTEFYFSRWFAVLPLLLMVVPTILLSIQGVVSTAAMIASGVIGLLAGSFLAKDKPAYWNIVTEALADRTGILVFALFLIVGIYAEILTATDLAEGLVWLSNSLQMGPAIYALFIYVICAILGTSMGTSVGIVLIMTPIMYPAAVAVGVPPGLAAGAILAGAATGDHLAPISDTTIISSSTQRYKFRSGSVSVSRVVRDRLKYVIPAFVISCLLYLIAGIVTSEAGATGISEASGNSDPRTLIMMIPMVMVVVAAIAGRSIFEALAYGIVVALVLALGMELLAPRDLFFIDKGNAKGVLVDGATRNLETIVMIVVMMGAYGVLRSSGLMESLIDRLNQNLSRDIRSTELTMFGIGWLMNFLLVGLVARVVVIAGPIFDELGRSHDIHPSRRANILDAVANSFSFIMPWHVWPLFMILTISPLLETYPDLATPKPTDFFMTSFYPIVIWIVMLIAIMTGFGRKFERKDAQG